MSKYFATYAATFVVMLVLDMIWLGFVAKSFYQDGIGHLMADRPIIPVAAAFYVMYAAGLVFFAVVSTETASGYGKTALYGALFGFFAYATYDLTNLATLKNWPVSLALVDMAWGATVSAVSAAAGKAALDRFAAG
jgi:uncharacterized membrane protein